MSSRARVVVLVDPVAEAHQPLVLVLHALQEVGDVLHRLDALEHPQHLLVGAAVQRAVQRGDAGRRRRVGVDLRRADRAHRGGRAVLLVVGVQDPQHVERALEPRVGLVLQLGHLEHHREEVAGVAEVVVRIDVRQPQVVAVGERRQRRHLRDQPHAGHVALGLVVDVVGVGVEGGQRADRGQQHPHRVGVVAEALDELLDVLVDEGVVGDLVDPLVQLVLRGQLAVDQEVGDLEVGRLLAQLVDRVAAVLEHPGLAVDVGDVAAAAGRVGEGRVVGHEAEVVLVDLHPAEVHGLHRAVGDLDLVLLAGAVVGDGQAVLRRGYTAAVLLVLRLFLGHVLVILRSGLLPAGSPLPHCYGSDSTGERPGQGRRRRVQRCRVRPAGARLLSRAS